MSEKYYGPYEQITEEQNTSLQRLLDRYDEVPEEIAVCAPWYDDPVGTLMVKFPFIVIGIEPDGYAHS